MRVAAAVSRAGRQVRGLYLVPDRQVERLRHIPAGRTLHLVDVENLMGGPTGALIPLDAAVARYRVEAPVLPGDHIVLASNPALAFAAGKAWPSARLLFAPGADGADLALLAVVENAREIAARYDRVIVGSGDGIFTSAVVSLRALGIAVGVVAPITGLSRQLHNAASYVRLVAPAPVLSIVP